MCECIFYIYNICELGLMAFMKFTHSEAVSVNKASSIIQFCSISNADTNLDTGHRTHDNNNIDFLYQSVCILFQGLQLPT